MIKDYLKAGYPTLCMLTYEPYRAEQLLRLLKKSEILLKL